MEYTLQKEKKFEYFETGKGAPLLLIHGLFGELSNFEDVIEKFKDRYRVNCSNTSNKSSKTFAQTKCKNARKAS